MRGLLQVGDRVRVYGAAKYRNTESRYVDTENFASSSDTNAGVFIVKESTGNGFLKLKREEQCGYDFEYLVHPKQCRRLIKKPKQRVWVNQKWLNARIATIWREADGQALSQDAMIVISKTERPGFIPFAVEVKRK